MVVAGPGSDEIVEFQFVRFWSLLDLAGPVTGEILESTFVRLMVFAGPACD